MDSCFNVKYYKMNLSRTRSNSFFKTKLPESTHNIFSNPLLDVATKSEIKRDNLVKAFFLKSLGKNSKIRKLILTNNKISNHPFQQFVLQYNDKETKPKKIDRELLEQRYNSVFSKPSTLEKGKNHVLNALTVAGSLAALATSSLAIAIQIRELKKKT